MVNMNIANKNMQPCCFFVPFFIAVKNQQGTQLLGNL